MPLQNGDAAAAMDAFFPKADAGLVDAETARALLAGCVRAVRLNEALHIVDYLQSRRMKISLKHFTSIVTSMPQRASPMDALDLLNALEPVVDYESRAIHNYHFHFAKLIVQEFLEEALQTLVGTGGGATSP